MNIVFYSNLFFTDCDFPLIREYQKKGNNVLYFVNIVVGRQCGGLFNIKSKLPHSGIVHAKEVPEFKMYLDYINLENVYLVLRSSNLFELSNWSTYSKLVKKISIFQPDVFHISSELGLSEIFLYKFSNIMVQTVHDPFMHSGEYNVLSEIKRRLSYRLSSKLIMLNKNQKTRFIEHYNLKNKPIADGCLGFYDCLNHLSRYKSYSCDKYKGLYILFFGHFSPYKGIDVLCEAMRKVHEVYPELYCVIAGKGTLDFDVSKYMQLSYIHVENRYIETEELVELIDKSLFVVCPYKDATQSGVVSSAFAFNKPVLATNVGGLGETVINNYTGILVEPNNVLALSNAIINLAKSPQTLISFRSNIELMKKQGERAWSNIADKYLMFYKTL